MANKKSFSFNQLPINRALKRSKKSVLLLLLVIGFIAGICYTKFLI